MNFWKNARKRANCQANLKPAWSEFANTAKKENKFTNAENLRQLSKLKAIELKIE